MSKSLKRLIHSFFMLTCKLANPSHLSLFSRAPSVKTIEETLALIIISNRTAKVIFLIERCSLCYYNFLTKNRYLVRKNRRAQLRWYASKCRRKRVPVFDKKDKSRNGKSRQSERHVDYFFVVVTFSRSDLRRSSVIAMLIFAPARSRTKYLFICSVTSAH